MIWWWTLESRLLLHLLFVSLDHCSCHHMIWFVFILDWSLLYTNTIAFGRRHNRRLELVRLIRLLLLILLLRQISQALFATYSKCRRLDRRWRLLPSDPIKPMISCILILSLLRRLLRPTTQIQVLYPLLQWFLLNKMATQDRVLLYRVTGLPTIYGSVKLMY